MVGALSTTMRSTHLTGAITPTMETRDSGKFPETSDNNIRAMAKSANIEVFITECNPAAAFGLVGEVATAQDKTAAGRSD